MTTKSRAAEWEVMSEDVMKVREVDGCCKMAKYEDENQYIIHKK